MSRHLAGRRPSWGDSFRHLDALHRVGGLVLGLGLGAFGIVGIVNRIGMFSTRGQVVLGLSSNRLLSIISLVVGAILIVAAIRGGRLSSTVIVVVGITFMLVGIGSVLVLDSDLNVLAFGMPNVIFSLVAGGMLLILGAYGRFTGRLPDDNPYRAVTERHGWPSRSGATCSRSLGRGPAGPLWPGGVRSAKGGTHCELHLPGGGQERDLQPGPGRQDRVGGRGLLQ